MPVSSDGLSVVFSKNEGLNISVSTTKVESYSPPAVEKNNFTPSDRTMSHSSLWLQIVILCVTWGVLCSLHWTNDGLWYQEDSPRHAITGLFWKDFLQNGWYRPVTYSMEYYARYPTICPTQYPPVFYLFEAAAFSLFRPSADIAKRLVLLFSLVVGGYTMAWLRRWIEPAAGMAAGLVLLTPGMTIWSHAVNVSVPAMAFGLAALYHVRRALESSSECSEGRHLIIGTALAALGILTHPLIGVVVFIGLFWTLALGRWRILLGRTTRLIAIATAVILIPAFLVLYRWGSQQFAQIWPPPGIPIIRWNALQYYGQELAVPLAGSFVLLSASSGILVGLARPRWRRETILLLIWLVVPYVILSFLWAKDVRYLLIACPALICLIAIGAIGVSDLLSHAISRFFRSRFKQAAPMKSNDGIQITADHFPFLRQRFRTQVALVVFLGLLVGRAISAKAEALRDPLPSVRQFVDVVTFIEQIAPSEPVLYFGRSEGVYAFHLRVRDPHFRRQMVSVRKFLGEGKSKLPHPEKIRDQLVSAGCRWFIMEVPIASIDSPLSLSLRKVVDCSDFEPIRTFPMSTSYIRRLQLYRIVRRDDDSHGAVPVFFDLPQEFLGRIVNPIRR